MKTLLLLCTMVLATVMQASNTLTSTLVVYKNAQGTSRYAVSLKWNYVSYEGHCVVLRSTVQGGYYQEISNSLDVVEFVDISPERDTTYYYVVEKVNNYNGEEAERSNEVKVVIP